MGLPAFDSFPRLSYSIDSFRLPAQYLWKLSWKRKFGYLVLGLDCIARRWFAAPSWKSRAPQRLAAFTTLYGSKTLSNCPQSTELNPLFSSSKKQRDVDDEKKWVELCFYVLCDQMQSGSRQGILFQYQSSYLNLAVWYCSWIGRRQCYICLRDKVLLLFLGFMRK